MVEEKRRSTQKRSPSRAHYTYVEANDEHLVAFILGKAGRGVHGGERVVVPIFLFYPSPFPSPAFPRDGLLLSHCCRS